MLPSIRETGVCMSKEKVKEIYGLIETKQEAIDLTRLG